ncbi:unnamed protein product [Paramecium pentaurelia]|uniref:Uncharacterized protein n=1 Tax=Paramecium pentaurelia TaxID=43138 RepID=A0A8S1XSH8_9CILI|nr:unnamed protein product [Paramecium pentaurelia]
MADLLFFYPLSSIERKFPYLYVLEIAGIKVMWSQGFPLHDLMYLTIQQKLKKVRLNESKDYSYKEGEYLFMNNTVRFDLQFINHIIFNEIDVFLVCTQMDLCLLNYLIRLKQFKPQIICTNATYLLGQHFIKELYQWSEIRNRHFYSFQENYNKEEESFKQFEELYHTNFQEFTEAFPFKEMDCTLVNYGQIVKIPLLQIQEAISIEAQSSGTGIGDSSYIISMGDYFKIVIANNLNNTNINYAHKEISLKLKDADYLICGIPQNRINYQFLSKTYELLQYGLNVVIPFNSYQTILDLQDEIDDNLQHKCFKIFIISQEFHNYTLIANSLVEYLNNKLQASIMKENPQNPFNKILFLIKAQKIIVAPSIEKIKFEGFSLNETLKGITPSVFFIFDSSLRLAQAVFLFDLLESIGQMTTIYTQKINNSDITFGLQLIDPEFYDEKLLHQIKSSYKFCIAKTPINNKPEFIPWSDSSIKTFLIPESTTIQTKSLVLNYKMLQKMTLRISQITIPIQPKLQGQGKNIIGNIELSNVKMNITNNEEAELQKSSPPDIQYIVGNIQDETIRRISEEIQKQFGLFPQYQSLQNIEFINMDNEICARVEILQDETKVYAKTQDDIKRISDIVYRCLTIRKL